MTSSPWTDREFDELRMRNRQRLKMPPEPLPLLLTDPDQFFARVNTGDLQKRVAGLGWFDIALGEIVRFGVVSDRETRGFVAGYYRDYVREVPESVRLMLLDIVVAAIERHPIVSTNALIPFIGDDTSRQVVAPAVRDYVDVSPILDGDPTRRPKEIVAAIPLACMTSPGAAFGGLLHLGDERVCRLIRPLRDTLPPGEVAEAVKCSGGFIHAAVVEFYLDWLEDLAERGDSVLFPIVANGFVLLKRWNLRGSVLTGARPFPATGIDDDAWMAMLRPVPLPDYVEGIVPRLRALAGRDSATMPQVLGEWGFAPGAAGNGIPALDRLRRTRPGRSGVIADYPPERYIDVEQERCLGEGYLMLVGGMLSFEHPAVFAVGECVFGDRRRRFMRWFHIFGGSTTYAAETGPYDSVTVPDFADIAVDIAALHNHRVAHGEPGFPGQIPSFLIASCDARPHVGLAKHLMAAGALAEADWGRELAYIRAFGSDFIRRIGCEARVVHDAAVAKAVAEGIDAEEEGWRAALYANWPGFHDATPPAFTSAPLSPEMLDEWWSLVNAPDYRDAALAVLGEIWIDRAAIVPDGARADVLPFDDIVDFFDRYPPVILD